MSIKNELEGTLFHYGFQECRKNENIQFSKLNDTDYLLIRFYGQHTADLFFARYKVGESPCDVDPADQETIKLSFDPETDGDLLRQFFRK